MSNQTLNLTDELYHYLLSVSLREPDILTALREETAKDEMSIMQISPEQGQFMSLLIKILNPKKIIEVGTFTGYSSLAMALASADDCRLICCDISEKWTSIAKRYWQQAQVAEKIKLHLAPALETLNQLLNTEGEGTVDFVFIDADKANYLNYYEKSLRLLRVGGVIAVDNVLWGGSVIDAEKDDEDTVAIREFNQVLRSDPRVDISMVPIADGLTLARKI